MRLALLGAFSFPVAQGSQRFAAEQARALGATGAETALFCYGRGDGRQEPGTRLVRAPATLSPRRVRAGFSPAKPVADLALARSFLADHRRRAWDAVLAHNAEAAALALAARRAGGPPVVYVAHTLWAEELSAYLPGAARRAGGDTGAAQTTALLAARLGDRLDGWLAGAADAVLALSRRGAEALARRARGPVARIPPGLATRPAPAPDQVARLAHRYGLVPGGFAVYAGNLDAYQDLPLLDAAASRVRELPVVALTHDPRGAALGSVALRVVRNPEEVRALLFGARMALLPRRRAGGFPIKLLHYMEAGLPIVAHSAAADTLTHGESAWLLGEGSGAGEWSHAIARLDRDPALRGRLGAGARRVLAAQHDWASLARETLELAALASRRASRPAPRADYRRRGMAPR